MRGRSNLISLQLFSSPISFREFRFVPCANKCLVFFGLKIRRAISLRALLRFNDNSRRHLPASLLAQSLLKSDVEGASGARDYWDNRVCWLVAGRVSNPVVNVARLINVYQRANHTSIERDRFSTCVASVVEVCWSAMPNDTLATTSFGSKSTTDERNGSGRYLKIKVDEGGERAFIALVNLCRSIYPASARDLSWKIISAG